MRGQIVRELSLVAAGDPFAPARSFPAFFWSDGSSAVTFRCEGRLLEAPGDDPWQAASALCSFLSEQSAKVAPSLPLAVGAFAFARSAPREPHPLWSGWPRAAWWIPRRIWLYQAGGPCLFIRHRWRDSAAPILPAGDLAGRRRARRNAASLPAWVSDDRSCGATTPAARSAEAEFMAKVSVALRAIAAGQLDKVVVARAEQIRAGSPFDPWAQLRALQERCPRAVTFALDRGPDGTWLGASPEILARLNNGMLTTSAIAGTSLAHAGDLETPLCSDKIHREHALVVRSIAAALEPLARELGIASEPRILRADRLLHLETPIHAALRDRVDLPTAARALHPTAALGGSPTDAALGWLAEHERLDRGYYGGPIGWIAPGGDGAMAVGIRSLLVRGNHALAYAGAGIVAGSDPENEWRETEHKLALALGTLAQRTSTVGAREEVFR